MLQIVVARYTENVEWAKQFPNVLIYNKGEALGEPYNEILLKNVGREGHTFYKHICDNYDSLEEYTMFLQGDPYDHKRDIEDIIKKFPEYVKNKNIDFCLLSDRLLDCNNYMHGPVDEVHEKLFGHRNFSKRYNFGAGGQFIVSKNRILKRPKEFYQKIVDLLKKHVNPYEGYAIERLHPLIFC